MNVHRARHRNSGQRVEILKGHYPIEPIRDWAAWLLRYIDQVEYGDEIKQKRYYHTKRSQEPEQVSSHRKLDTAGFGNAPGYGL